MDKTRRLYPLSIQFADGELPSASKLTGISTQAKNALGIVELMLGDTWNQAGDPILSPGGTPTLNALHIPNIARSVGKMSLLNAMVPGTTPLSSSMVYVDDIGASYGGLTRGFLRYLPQTTPSQVNMILSGTFAPLVQANFKSDPILVKGTGQWCVTSDGRFFSWDNMPATLSLTYAPSIKSDVGDLGSPSASWNVIPDPGTWGGNYSGVKISLANNTDTSLGYHIWLPPRLALGPAKTIRMSPTQTNNIDTTPDSGSILFYQDSSMNASITNANHYRYNFPTEITSIGGSGDTLPGGFIYIWDETTGTILDGATFFVPGTIGHRKFKIRATGTNLIAVFGATIGNGIVTDDTTQIPADYISRFKIITVGASLSKVLSYLNKDHWNHVHKKSEYGNPVSHADLDNLVSPSWDAITNNIYPSGISTFTQSSWKVDDHPQYLQRAGSTMNLTTARDKDDNCMLRLFGVKSPLTAYNQGRVNLSVTDDGMIANLTATTFTTLNIGGGTGIINGDSGGQVNLDKVQVNKRLYFSDTGSPSNTLSNNFLEFDNDTDTFSFAAEGSFGIGTVAAESLIAATVVTTSSVTAQSDIIAAGDFNSTTRFGSFKYTTNRYQYLNLYPTAMPLSAQNIADGLAFDFAAGGIINNSTSNTSVLYVTVPFPNGAIVTPSESLKIWSRGNGTDGITFTLISPIKPTASFGSVTAPTLLGTFTANTTTTNNLSTAAYGTTHTVDTSFTGRWYAILITFPVKISTNAPVLWGLTFQYRMAQVDN